LRNDISVNALLFERYGIYMNDNINNALFVQGFIRMCDDGFNQGWHERNGGNLTYRIKPEEIEEVKSELKDDGEWFPIGTSVPGLAGEYFLVTGSGKYFRNVILDPWANIAIVKIDDNGEKYKIVYGLEKGGKPTSELPSHLMNHEVKKRVTNGEHRVIYHCHTTNVIALTFVLPLEDKVFTRELWEMATECPVVFPSGVGVVHWMVPGGRDIAVETSKLMEMYDVAIWAHHGIFCSGADFDLTFGLAHTVEKAAEILVKTLSMQNYKLQTIEPQEFRNLAKDFKVDIPEKFLYDKTTKYVINTVDTTENKSIIRKSFKMKLFEGMEDEYERRHNELWPEMKEMIHEYGGHNYSIFLDKETNILYGYIELENEEKWAKSADTEICRKWWDYMADIMETNPDNSPVSTDLKNVFFLK